MTWLQHIENVYNSLIEPPAGYVLKKTEIIRDKVGELTALDRELQQEFRDSGWFESDEEFTLKGKIIFRAIVQCPDGKKTYVVSEIDSIAELCKKNFWEEFWEEIEVRNARST